MGRTLRYAAKEKDGLQAPFFKSPECRVGREVWDGVDSQLRAYNHSLFLVGVPCKQDYQNIVEAYKLVSNHDTAGVEAWRAPVRQLGLWDVCELARKCVTSPSAVLTFRAYGVHRVNPAKDTQWEPGTWCGSRLCPPALRSRSRHPDVR